MKQLNSVNWETQDMGKERGALIYWGWWISTEIVAELKKKKKCHFKCGYWSWWHILWKIMKCNLEFMEWGETELHWGKIWLPQSYFSLKLIGKHEVKTNGTLLRQDLVPRSNFSLKLIGELAAFLWERAIWISILKWNTTLLAVISAWNEREMVGCCLVLFMAVNCLLITLILEVGFFSVCLGNKIL